MELGNLTVTGAGNFSTTLTTPCTACIQNMTNTSMTYTEKNMGYGLSDQELMKALNPGLYFVGTYAYILWYVIGLPANTFAFCVWIQRQVRAKMNVTIHIHIGCIHIHILIHAWYDKFTLCFGVLLDFGLHIR